MDYTITLTDEQVAAIEIYQKLVGPLPLIGGYKSQLPPQQWIERTLNEILVGMINTVNAENDRVMLTTVKEDVDILATVQTKIADIKAAKKAAIAAEIAAKEAAELAAAKEARIAAELAAIEAGKLGDGKTEPPVEPPVEEPIVP